MALILKIAVEEALDLVRSAANATYPDFRASFEYHYNDTTLREWCSYATLQSWIRSWPFYAVVDDTTITELVISEPGYSGGARFVQIASPPYRIIRDHQVAQQEKLSALSIETRKLVQTLINNLDRIERLIAGGVAESKVCAACNGVGCACITCHGTGLVELHGASR